MTQSMAFSPYKKPFEERLMRWEAQLSLVSEVIDEWLALQRAWMYLEPIFSSPDILQQLPQEGKRYSSVDRIWRKVRMWFQSTRMWVQSTRLWVQSARMWVSVNNTVDSVNKDEALVTLMLDSIGGTGPPEL